MAIYQIRRSNARHLAMQFKNRREFADAADLTSSQLSQLIGPNPTENIGASIAKRIEKAGGKDAGWLDREHLEVTGKQQVAPPDRLVDPDKLMVAVRDVWDAMESQGEKITPTILVSAALIYIQLKDMRGESNSNDVAQSIGIARSTIKSLDSSH
ncbi:hypothetical protein [uncultured Microbulbifer sp.]|uniref:hypothetical protein n=1 Tax=uncultured Microbulbifer sp. TaxID=348147 RepID=UPI002610E26A|nr:hypothetical protein [uncultured Microbulbifer sp.]